MVYKSISGVDLRGERRKERGISALDRLWMDKETRRCNFILVILTFYN